MCFCFVFLLVMDLEAGHLLFGWYSSGCLYCVHGYCCLDASRGYSYPICILTFSCINFILLLSTGCTSLTVASEDDLVEIPIWRCRSNLSSITCIMVIWIEQFLPQEQIQWYLSIRHTGFEIWQPVSKSFSSRKRVTMIWMNVFA